MRLHEIESNPKQDAKRYLPGFIDAYNNMAATQSAQGVDMTQRRAQELTLSGIIGRYARLTQDQLPFVKKMITQSNLTDQNQLKNILYNVLVYTLQNRTRTSRAVIGKADVAEPAAGAARPAPGKAPRAPRVRSASQSPSIPPIGAKVNYAGSTYTWANNAWRAGAEPPLTGSDAQSATRQYWNPEQ